MIVPIRCYTCGKVLANKWNHYQTMLDSEYSESAALEALGITRYCCRRMLISHVDFIHKILTFTPQESSTIDHSSSKFRIDSEIEGPPTTSFNNELTFTDDDSPRYDVEGSPTYVSFRNRFDLSPRTPIDASIISRDQSLLSRYVQSESSSRYSHNEGNFSESSPGQINQSFPVYELSSYTDDGSPTYEASYQSEQIGDNCSPRYLPEHEQTNDDDSSRYSPYDF